MHKTYVHLYFSTRPNQYKVRVGSSYSEKGGKLHEVGDLIWHPNFDYKKMDSDIALMWLSEPLEFSHEVAPIPMANQDEEIADGEITIVTGWGDIMVSANGRRCI